MRTFHVILLLSALALTLAVTETVLPAEEVGLQLCDETTGFSQWPPYPPYTYHMFGSEGACYTGYPAKVHVFPHDDTCHEEHNPCTP